jgi:hypothetical protein
MFVVYGARYTNARTAYRRKAGFVKPSITIGDMETRV